MSETAEEEFETENYLEQVLPDIIDEVEASNDDKSGDNDELYVILNDTVENEEEEEENEEDVAVEPAPKHPRYQ